ncbi:MAG: hypothetical protein D6725_10180 [Planctomycetota bacterium]|nr:MAG: hypothetical protein D6725_10180 [Planctomycetota bacterium]
MIPPLYDGESGGLMKACVIVFQPHDRRPAWAERWIDALTRFAELVEITSLEELVELDEADETVSCIVVHAEDFDTFLREQRASEYWPVRLQTYPLVVIDPQAGVADAVRFAQHGAVEVVVDQNWVRDDASIRHYVAAALNADRHQFAGRRRLRKLLRRFMSLTPRQQQVVLLVGKGADTERIARQCGIKTRTVMEHRRAARQLLGARNMAELARMAVEIAEAIGEVDEHDA